MRPTPPRISRLPIIIIFVSLLALGALPIIFTRYVDAYRNDVRELVEPARSLVTELYISLALSNAALRDFLTTKDTVFLQFFRNAADREVTALNKLGGLSERLDADVQVRYHELHDAQTRWYSRVNELLRVRPLSLNRIRESFATEEFYENTLTAAARLDEALTRVAAERRNRIGDAERVVRRLGLGLATLAAVAAVFVLLLGRRLGNYARMSEEARAELERVLAGRARLARSITHDLKNPLNVIVGNIKLLDEDLEGELNPGQRDRVRKVERSAAAMLTMINSLLELERVRAGDVQLDIKPVDLGALVRETIENHRAAIEQKGLELQSHISADIGTVETDPQRVQRVLDNLLTNATKYTDRGFVFVHAALARRRSEPEAWIAIAVQDSGRGIHETQLEEVFEEFSRFESGNIPGTGLGLAVSRKLASALGGDVTVRSEPGVGSTFTLWLPQEPQREATK